MIKYEFSFPNPNNHIISIEMKIKNIKPGKFDLILPAWRPGRYELAPFVENILQFNPVNDQDTPLQWIKTKFNVWTIDNPILQDIKVCYQYFANKMDAGNSVVDNTQVYLNFINCTFFNDTLIKQPHTIDIDLPIGHEWSSALEHQTKNTWTAQDYYQLVDAPIIAAQKLHILTYKEGSCEFEIVFNGDHPLEDQEIINDFRKFTKSQIKDMGSFPTQRYLFLIQSLPYKHYHGVEHQNSTVLILGPNTAEHKSTYREMLLGVASHELFHTWNVTRIRPQELSPYNFASETYFDTGFVAEGFTTYYGDYYLKKSGVFSEEEYFIEINRLLKRHFENYGRFESSLAQSSINLWVDGYKNITPAKKVSIYVKGALVSLIMDLTIRKATNNQSSLINVVQQLMQTHTDQQGGYTKEDVFSIVERLTDSEISTLFDQLIHGTEDLTPHLESVLDYVGCQIRSLKHSCPFTSLTGAQLKENEVISIAPNSPADRLISIGDIIIKLNQSDFKPDQSIDFQTFDLFIIRLGQEKSVPMTINGQTYFDSYQIKKMTDPNKTQKSNFDQWINN
ncbi:MAG: M61 family peptidase [Reichenbachiella sp.]